MKLLLKHDQEIVATLELSRQEIILSQVNASYRFNLERLLKNGIDFPERSALSKYNSRPQGKEFLEKIAGLYKSILNVSAEFL